MKSTFKIIFYIKRQVVKIDGSSPIMGRITVNGTMSQFSCKLSVNPEMWNVKSHRATGKDRDMRELNKELDHICKSITKHYKKIFEGMGPLTAERVRNSYLGFDRSSHTLMSVFVKHNEEFEALAKNELRSQSSFMKYNTVYRHLKQFLCKRYKLKDIAFEDIQSSFIVDFELYIRKELKCSNNTVWTYLMPLKKMIGIAQNNGWLDGDPFYGYKLTYKQKERSYLTTEELNGIMNLDLSHCNKTKQKCRDLFIFSCFTCNEHLKYIIKQCEIDKPVTWHVSRHTFASEVCLLNGVPIETISRLLGHTSVKTTQIYAKISDTAIDRDMAALSKKLNQMEKFVTNF